MTFLQQIIVRRRLVNTRGTPAAASPRGRHLTLATIGVLAPWMMSGGTLTPLASRLSQTHTAIPRCASNWCNSARCPPLLAGEPRRPTPDRPPAR